MKSCFTEQMLFMPEKLHVMVQMADIHIDHFRQRHLAAFVVGADAREGFIRQAAENLGH